MILLVFILRLPDIIFDLSILKNMFVFVSIYHLFEASDWVSWIINIVSLHVKAVGQIII